MKIKINLKLIMAILLIFPFIKPNYIIHIKNLNIIYNIMQVIDFAIIIFLYIKNMRVTKQLLLIIVMQIILIIATFVNNGEIIESIINSMQIIAFSLIIYYLMQKNIKIFFKAISIILLVLVCINFITILIKPEGYLIGYLKKWFFGTKNNHFSIILPAIACNYISCLYIKDRKRLNIVFFILILISISSVLFLESATSLVALFITLLYFPLRKFIKKINLKIFFCMYIIMFLLIVGFQFQNKFSFIIEDLLNKDLTFTGRITAWEKSIDFISEKPLIGYGIENQDYRVAKFGKTSFVHCHNMILEIFYKGGIVLFILFVSFLKIVIRNINKIKNIDLRNFCLWILVIYSIALFTEVYSFEVLLWMLLILSNTFKIEENERKLVNE